jgi:succinate dehydrogenase/fumarate reductase flavoprotein subunit
VTLHKQNIELCVVGTGLARGSAAATLAVGYNVAFVQMPRRAHSIACTGGITVKKKLMGDGDSFLF